MNTTPGRNRRFLYVTALFMDGNTLVYQQEGIMTHSDVLVFSQKVFTVEQWRLIYDVVTVPLHVMLEADLPARSHCMRLSSVM